MEPIYQAMQFWKTYKEPAKRMELILLSHRIKIVGGKVNRRQTTVLLSLILASAMLGSAIPDCPAD